MILLRYTKPSQKHEVLKFILGEVIPFSVTETKFIEVVYTKGKALIYAYHIFHSQNHTGEYLLVGTRLPTVLSRRWLEFGSADLAQRQTTLNYNKRKSIGTIYTVMMVKIMMP